MHFKNFINKFGKFLNSFDQKQLTTKKKKFLKNVDIEKSSDNKLWKFPVTCLKYKIYVILILLIFQILMLKIKYFMKNYNTDSVHCSNIFNIDSNFTYKLVRHFSMIYGNCFWIMTNNQHFKKKTSFTKASQSRTNYN